MAPRFSTGRSLHEVEWLEDESTFARSLSSRDAKDIRTSLLAVSRARPKRAAKAVSMILDDKQNSLFAKEFIKLMSPRSETCYLDKLIVDGIRASILHHTSGRGGSRTTASETFIKNVCCACMFNIAKNKVKVSRKVLTSFIGVSMRQIHLALTKASDLIENNKVMGTLDRQLMKDYIQVKLEPHVYSFLLDDDYTRLDTNQGLLQVIDPRTGEETTEHKRIWLIVNKEQQHSLFLSSDHYAKFQQEHNGASVSYGIWHDVMDKVGSIVSNPKPESCVDKKTSGLQHMMAVILGFIK